MSRGIPAIVVMGLALTVVVGGVVGLITRLIIAGDSSNTEILPSVFGLIAFICIGMGLYGMLSGFRQMNASRFVWSLLLLVGGIVWVVPFPG